MNDHAYAAFTVMLHARGDLLAKTGTTSLEELRQKIQVAVEDHVHPNREFVRHPSSPSSGDVDVELDESAP